MGQKIQALAYLGWRYHLQIFYGLDASGYGMCYPALVISAISREDKGSHEAVWNEKGAPERCRVWWWRGISPRGISP